MQWDPTHQQKIHRPSAALASSIYPFRGNRGSHPFLPRARSREASPYLSRMLPVYLAVEERRFKSVSSNSLCKSRSESGEGHRLRGVETDEGGIDAGRCPARFAPNKFEEKDSIPDTISFPVYVMHEQKPGINEFGMVRDPTRTLLYWSDAEE